MNPLASATMPLVRLLDPETAHRLALLGLRLGACGRDGEPENPRLAVEAWGLRFPNPLGLAAGFDKNAVAVAPLARLGFGHIEVGTVTLRPQQGNPRPRLFRLPEDRGVINRMGFPNEGIEVLARRLAALQEIPVPVGVNLGINREGADPERDYAALAAAVAPYADYIAINVSSPNTPGLRDLQAPGRLAAILAAIAEKLPTPTPVLVKLAPDLPDEDLPAIVETCVAGGAAGLIVANTTLSRPPGLRSRHAAEAGGLSGPPLRPLATAMLRRVARLAVGRLTLVGVGGVATGADVLEKLRAGATLVQVYTAFAYDGPALLSRLKRELLAALEQHGFATVTDAIGADLFAKPNVCRPGAGVAGVPCST